MSQRRNRSLPAAAWTLAGLALLAAPAAVTAFERIDGIVLDTGGQFDDGVLRSAVIDPAGEFAYFSTDFFINGRVVKIDLETFERVDTLPRASEGTERYEE